VQEYDARKTKYSVQKEANLVKQKCMTQETAARIIKNQHESSIENKKIVEFKRQPMHGQFCRDLERPSVDKENSLAWVCS
jgi:hypothetical protein